VRTFMIWLVALNVILGANIIARAIRNQTDVYLCMEAIKLGVHGPSINECVGKPAASQTSILEGVGGRG
jgi:hypothetical protein